MDVDEQSGAFWANVCMTQALIGKLIELEILSPDDVQNLTGDAEGYLAGLSPSLMSEGARDHAKVLIQNFGKIR